MKDGNKKTINTEKIRGVIARVLLIAVACAGIAYAADNTSAGETKLQNGSFEDGPTFTGNYSQPDQGSVPYWNTTAFQGKIELLKTNTGTYIPGVTVTPSDGDYAAELNADEESTLYQNVKTSPSSVYEWGLDHGARNGKDIMALVIGPKQSVDPSKPSKDGRDQFMQMVDWLKDPKKNNAISEEINTIKSGKTPKQYTVYSKKFAASGAFKDNAGNNAFSLTPSTIYTEEWHIWIMASSKATSGTNPWNSYGSNAEGSAGSSTDTGNTNVDLSKYYLYTVPAGQTETVFGFVSVGYEGSSAGSGNAKTYGNFLDNINFQLYHPLSGSTTVHGSAVIGGSNGTTEGTGADSGHQITIGSKLVTYVTDGEQLKIQAVIKSKDAAEGCEFVGVYSTVLDKNGKPQTTFLKLAGNEIEDTGNLTNEEKKGKWIKSTNTDGDIIYTYYLDNVTSPTDLHFVFIKSPTITYDPNGGKDYVVERKYNTDEAANVYSFKPAADVPDTEAGTSSTFISPYVSYAAEAPDGKDGWKFMGWLLTGDTVENVPSDKQVNADQLGNMILSADHTIACDYELKTGEGENTKEQYFKIYNGKVDLTKTINKNGDEVTGVTWSNNGAKKVYANVHQGITLVAQWRWLQAFIPQEHNALNYENSDVGGTVEITSVTDTSDKNYNAEYNKNGGKSYHAATDETIVAKATANTGYTFEGWYDNAGNLVTTQDTISYIETKEGVNTYYARFSNSVTQTYIRQIEVDGKWVEITDNNIGIIDRYTYTDARGKSISATATDKDNYKFLGWYDENGNFVTQNNTLSYTTTGNATYYARFKPAYYAKFVAQTKQADGSFKTDTVGGKVSVDSAKNFDGCTVSSTATPARNAKFLGWYDKDGKQLTTNKTYSPTVTKANKNTIYYARFEILFKEDSKAYLSFVAESENVTIPDAFKNSDTGTVKNNKKYGRDDKLGNTISTGFKYTIYNAENISTIKITIKVPKNTSYVKICDSTKGLNLSVDAKKILTDSENVTNNKGSIQELMQDATLTYYWDVSGLESGKTYGFVVDNIYAPNATAEITLNDTSGAKVVNETNGVVNQTKDNYKKNSKYKDILQKLLGWIFK